MTTLEAALDLGGSDSTAKLGRSCLASSDLRTIPPTTLDTTTSIKNARSRQRYGSRRSFAGRIRQGGPRTKAISAFRDFKEISARNVGIVFLVFDSAGGKIECREMRREQRNVTAVDFLEGLVMVLSEILMPPSVTFLF